jgi:hypothetical protein
MTNTSNEIDFQPDETIQPLPEHVTEALKIHQMKLTSNPMKRFSRCLNM